MGNFSLRRLNVYKVTEATLILNTFIGGIHHNVVLIHFMSLKKVSFQNSLLHFEHTATEMGLGHCRADRKQRTTVTFQLFSKKNEAFNHKFSNRKEP